MVSQSVGEERRGRSGAPDVRTPRERKSPPRGPVNGYERSPPAEAQRPSGSGGYFANVTPTVNARPRAGNPFTSEYSRSSTFPTLSRSSAGTHAASETTAPRSREA